MRDIKILADERSAEALADALMDAGVLSASLEDADADRPDEQPLYGEPGLEPEQCAWPRSIVSLLVEDDFDLDAALQDAVAAVGCKTPEVLGNEDVPDQDWVRITQAQFQPVRVSDRLWIVPTWHDVPSTDAVNVRLDPGVAFGTGSHPTTHLCLQWLDEHVGAEDEILDYGCGTGILAIAAKLLGAKRVLGTDIDPQAVDAAVENARMNGTEAEFYLPNAMPQGDFDIVVANILANPLKLLAPALIGRVRRGGRLVLSGVLKTQAEEVISHYMSLEPGLTLAVWKTEGDWVCIAGELA